MAIKTREELLKEIDRIEKEIMETRRELDMSGYPDDWVASMRHRLDYMNEQTAQRRKDLESIS